MYDALYLCVETTGKLLRSSEFKVVLIPVFILTHKMLSPTQRLPPVFRKKKKSKENVPACFLSLSSSRELGPKAHKYQRQKCRAKMWSKPKFLEISP